MHRLHPWFDHQGERNRYQPTAVIDKPPAPLHRSECQSDTALSTGKAMLVSICPALRDVDRTPLV